jgi:hypothetical protein
VMDGYTDERDDDICRTVLGDFRVGPLGSPSLGSLSQNSSPLRFPLLY